MRRICGMILAAALLFAGTACNTVPFRRTDSAPTMAITTTALLDGLWDAGTGRFLIRQSALFELQGMRIPITGVMKLDCGKKTARLVGLNDMGVKLFDIAIDRTTSEALFVMPDLARYPEFASAVATSVRRIFLDPAPLRDDALTITADRYRLARNRDGKTVTFLFGGRDRQLLEKSGTAPEEEWVVRYYEHTERDKLPIPGGIILDDDKAGYRLTLWIESVEPTDE